MPEVNRLLLVTSIDREKFVVDVENTVEGDSTVECLWQV